MAGRGNREGHNRLYAPEEGVLVYERHSDEPDTAWRAFVHYRAMGIDRRTHKRVALALGKTDTYVRTIDRFAVAWSWQERSVAWDREKDKAVRSAEIGVVAARHREMLEATEKVNYEMAEAAEGLWKLAAKDLARWQKMMEEAPDDKPVFTVRNLVMLAETGIKLHRLLTGEATERFGSDGTLEPQVMNFGNMQVKF